MHEQICNQAQRYVHPASHADTQRQQNMHLLREDADIATGWNCTGKRSISKFPACAIYSIRERGIKRERAVERYPLSQSATMWSPLYVFSVRQRNPQCMSFFAEAAAFPLATSLRAAARCFATQRSLRFFFERFTPRKNATNPHTNH